jgi:phosphoribosylformimino-5-aminoimidazole carboxamide ribotide isomerase
MKILPAIDLRGGNVVRLLRGDYDQQTTYAHDPVAIALRWKKEGAEILHIVDLDGAREGISVNIEVVRRIAAETALPIQFGGGIRSVAAIKTVREAGVSRAVIGTKALEKPLLKEMIDTFGKESVVVGIDAVDGIVKTQGWLTSSGITVEHACEQIIECGVKHIVFTDISRDGTLAGPNIASLQKVLAFRELSVVASGGIGSLDDVKKICTLEDQNIFGIIIGKALYENTVDLAAAIAVTRENRG